MWLKQGQQGESRRSTKANKAGRAGGKVATKQFETVVECLGQQSAEERILRTNSTGV